MSAEDAPRGPSALEAGEFLAEVAMYGALVYVGVTLGSSVTGRVALAIVLPAVVVLVWGRWLAPRASRRLGLRPVLALKVAIFAVVSVLLALVGPVVVAIAFFVISEAVILAAGRAAARRR